MDLELFAARRSLAAYENTDYVFPTTHTQLSIKEYGKILVVEYCGSEHLINWLYNFCVLPSGITPYENTNSQIKVHKGMLEAYLVSRDLVLREVGEKHSSVETILFTGHSLGGNLACFAALDCQYNLGIDPRVIVFGKPATGNIHFVESYNRRVPQTTHIFNPYDPIVNLPMHLLGYYSVGKEQKVTIPWIFTHSFPYVNPHSMYSYFKKHNSIQLPN